MLADRSFLELDLQKHDKFKSQIMILKETVKGLETQVENKKKQGEEIYN